MQNLIELEYGKSTFLYQNDFFFSGVICKSICVLSYVILISKNFISVFQGM